MSENGDLTVTGGAFGSMRGGRGPEGFKLEFLNLTMPALAELLTPHVDHPVVDMTGLKGAYEFSWTNRPPPGDDGGGRKNVREAVRSPDDTGPHPGPLGEALFTAMTKAGLKTGGPQSANGDNRSRSPGEIADRELKLFHCSRSTITGSTRVARRAGNTHAVNPTSASVTITADSTSGSSGFTP